MIMNRIRFILSAMMAGILIALAGTIYLSVKSENAVLGAFLFGFGLLTVVSLDYKLYTGRIGYLIDQPKSYIIDILWIIVGNVLGSLLIASIIHLGQLHIIIDGAKDLVDYKLAKDFWTMFAQSILCGMMMYLGVDGYKRATNDVAKVVINIFAVVIFILAGFEHSIANIYYFFLANIWSFHTVLWFLMMLIGNGIGSILLNLIEKVGKLKKV